MRRNFLALIIWALASLICFAGVGHASIIVDTGPGPASGNPLFLDWNHNGMAGKFTTSKTWKITSVQVWMQLDHEGQASAVIFRDDGGGTIPGTRMFSQSVTLAANPVAAWQGAAGLDWTLPPGTYWVGFEVPDTSFIEGLLYYPPPSPLVAYASAIYGNGWASLTGFDTGFRVQGTPINPPGPIDLLLTN